MKWSIGVVVIGAVAFLLFLYEWNFVRRARSGHAVVIQASTYRPNERTIPEVEVIGPGPRMRATLRACFWDLKPGQIIPILYLPNDSGSVILDSYGQRHYYSIEALSLCVLLAAWKVRCFLERHHREAITPLPDDYVVPDDYVALIAGTRGAPPLRIDTSPRLWDHDLDG